MNKTGPQFYFSLLRLLALLRGGDARRAENNGAEAWLGGLAVNLISYLFFAQFLPADLKIWQSVLLLGLLAFLVWLFWLVVIYLNSLVIQFLRFCGLFQTIPIRRAQSILLGTWTTAMACGLLQSGSWPREIASIWLVMVAMNLTAAVVLFFTYGTRSRE
ncbi:MAG: hypothetical protein DLM73_02515 [Chthoniobacterales bacterium]|nr:MAG: hypothetical protein DLM73_02515 [Chthoniobacterales bacterium]